MGEVVAVVLEWPSPIGKGPERWALADNTSLRPLPGVLSLVQPLWWPTNAHPSGALVDEAWDHLLRLLVGRHVGTCPSLSFVEEVAEEAVQQGLASRVIRFDAEGRRVEVTSG